MAKPISKPSQQRPLWVLLVSGFALGAILSAFSLYWLQFLQPSLQHKQYMSSVVAVSTELAAGHERYEKEALPPSEAPVSLVGDEVAEGDVFGIVWLQTKDEEGTIVEPGWEGTILAVGTSSEVLAQGNAGWYVSTTHIGEAGNTAVAVNYDRLAQVNESNRFSPGDELVVQTRQGWYMYEYRDSETVAVTEEGVLFPVPHVPGQEPADKLFTITTSNEEEQVTAIRFRMVGYLSPETPPQKLESALER